MVPFVSVEPPIAYLPLVGAGASGGFFFFPQPQAILTTCPFTISFFLTETAVRPFAVASKDHVRIDLQVTSLAIPALMEGGVRRSVHRLQVIWVHARSVSADMVNHFRLVVKPC